MRREDVVDDCAGLRGGSEIFERDTGSAWVAQLVERVLGKDEVTGSIPVPGSRIQSRGRKLESEVR